MIATLSGKVTATGHDWAIIEAAGVGYEVFLATRDAAELSLGDQAQVVIYDHIREDQHSLYGFLKPESKAFFVQLIGISGIGPKVALAVLSTSSLETLQQAVAAGDAAVLRGVAGVGTKTAERIIVELRGKLAPAAEQATAGGEVYQALIGLGYSSAQAAAAVAKLPPDVKDPAEAIRRALKGLSK